MRHLGAAHFRAWHFRPAMPGGTIEWVARSVLRAVIYAQKAIKEVMRG